MLVLELPILVLIIVFCLELYDDSDVTALLDSPLISNNYNGDDTNKGSNYDNDNYLEFCKGQALRDENQYHNQF